MKANGKRVTPEMEAAYLAARSVEARNAIVEALADMAVGLARERAACWPDIDAEALEGEALAALIPAVESFDPSRGGRLVPFVRACVVRDLINWVAREQAWARRRVAAVGGGRGGNSRDEDSEEAAWVEPESREPGPADAAAAREVAAIVQAEAASSPARARCVEAVFGRGLSYVEAAREAGTRRQTVRKLVEKVIAGVRRKVA